MAEAQTHGLADVLRRVQSDFLSSGPRRSLVESLDRVGTREAREAIKFAVRRVKGEDWREQAIALAIKLAEDHDRSQPGSGNA